MRQSEQCREQERGWPEAHAGCQSELKVTAEGEFLSETNQHKGGSPGSGGKEESFAVNRNAGEMKTVERKDGKKAGADGEEADESSYPEVAAKSELCR